LSYLPNVPPNPIEHEDQMTSDRWVSFHRTDGAAILSLVGIWRLESLCQISQDLETLDVHRYDRCALDGTNLLAIDTSGAALLQNFLRARGLDPRHVSLQHFRPEHESILKLVQARPAAEGPVPPRRKPGLAEVAGRGAADFVSNIHGTIAFIGRVALEFGRVCLARRRFRTRELFFQLEAVGLRAVPIVCLVTFLIGIVIAYLFGLQLALYGAKIFVIDAVARAMTRELSPMLVAIIVAGRSGATFTAQLGTMRVTEEIDAIETLGLSPVEVLVLPRVLALVVVLPFLVFIGDVAGLMGSMLVTQWQLDISYVSFVTRLQNVLPLRTFYLGLVKAPVFAFFIATIGCRMGLAVRRDARSVGLNTTSTVVQSIVAVILLDAAFALVFVETVF